MNVSVYELTVPQFILTLKSLKKILGKAKVYAENKRIDVSVLLQTRLAPDQFPLSRQIQIACDNAKACAARLTGTDAPVFEDKELSFDEFINRIDKTITFLETIKPDQFKDYESRRATFPWHPGKYLEGTTYLIQHALPNFYFHITTAYSILRANGLDIGKTDYLGEQNWKSL